MASGRVFDHLSVDSSRISCFYSLWLLMAKHRKLFSQVLKNSKSEASSDIQESVETCTTYIFLNDGWDCDEWNDGWSFDEWNDYWSSVGWHEGWKQTFDTSASSFSLGGLDVSATSSPKRFEWVKMNLEQEMGRFYRTASGEWILDGGAWQFQGYDENGIAWIFERETHWSSRSFVQCGRNRVQRTTRILLRT